MSLKIRTKVQQSDMNCEILPNGYTSIKLSNHPGNFFLKKGIFPLLHLQLLDALKLNGIQ